MRQKRERGEKKSAAKQKMTVCAAWGGDTIHTGRQSCTQTHTLHPKHEVDRKENAGTGGQTRKICFLMRLFRDEADVHNKIKHTLGSNQINNMAKLIQPGQ